MKRIIMSMCRWMSMFIIGIGIPVWAWAVDVVFPPAGAKLAVGETYTIQVRSSPGEELVEVGMPFDDIFTFNSATGMFEWVETIRQDIPLGPSTWDISAYDRKKGQIDLTIPVVYVLPPTTVVVGINALVENAKDTILEIYRTAAGELENGNSSTAEITVGGMYSDGVKRGVASHPETTYTSTNESVVTITPPSKRGQYPTVNAVGRGVADIIVQYGPYKDTVMVKVWECPEEAKDNPSVTVRGKCKR